MTMGRLVIWTWLFFSVLAFALIRGDAIVKTGENRGRLRSVSGTITDDQFAETLASSGSSQKTIKKKRMTDAMAAERAATEDDSLPSVSSTKLTKRDSHCLPGPKTIQMCRDFMPYSVHVPGILGFHDLTLAGYEAHQFYPLVKVDCSPYLQSFICRTYFPSCGVSGGSTYPVGPCRELCEGARSGCEELMNEYGFEWPSAFNCSRFPVSNNGARECFGL